MDSSDWPLYNSRLANKEAGMHRLLVALSLAVLLPSAIVVGQSTPLVGSWKANLSKSKFSPGPAPRSQTLTWRSVAAGLEFTVDTVGADGKPTKTVTIEKVDGGYAPVLGSTTPTMRRLRRIDDHTYEDGDTVNGKPTVTRRIAISPDARSLTITMSGTNVQGQTVNNVVVFEKQ